MFVLHIIQEKHKSELEALKSTHAASITSQATDCEMYKLQIDNDRINIEQLKKALDSYQQREVRCVEIFVADFFSKFNVTTMNYINNKNSNSTTANSNSNSSIITYVAVD